MAVDCNVATWRGDTGAVKGIGVAVAGGGEKVLDVKAARLLVELKLGESAAGVDDSQQM